MQLPYKMSIKIKSSRYIFGMGYCPIKIKINIFIKKIFYLLSNPLERNSKIFFLGRFSYTHNIVAIRIAQSPNNNTLKYFPAFILAISNISFAINRVAQHIEIICIGIDVLEVLLQIFFHKNFKSNFFFFSNFSFWKLI